MNIQIYLYQKNYTNMIRTNIHIRKYEYIGITFSMLGFRFDVRCWIFCYSYKKQYEWISEYIDMNMIRTNICIGKYSIILENPNIRHTLFGNLRFKVIFMKLLTICLHASLKTFFLLSVHVKPWPKLKYVQAKSIDVVSRYIIRIVFLFVLPLMGVAFDNSRWEWQVSFSYLLRSLHNHLLDILPQPAATLGINLPDKTLQECETALTGHTLSLATLATFATLSTFLPL